eukprot:7382805-Prymnesium_polylepis.1
MYQLCLWSYHTTPPSVPQSPGAARNTLSCLAKKRHRTADTELGGTLGTSCSCTESRPIRFDVLAGRVGRGCRFASMFSPARGAKRVSRSAHGYSVPCPVETP